MQRFLVLVVFLGLVSLPLMAQDYPKALVLAVINTCTWGEAVRT